MKEVVFLYNELLDENKQKLYRLPLTFICFAYLEGAQMYSVKDRPYITKAKKKYRVYGAIYVLNNSHQNLKVLDAIMENSKGLIGKNHANDINWREKVLVTPIHFDTIEDFFKMRYNETDEIKAITYLVNTSNNYIKNNVIKSWNRDTCDFDINNFLLLMERNDVK